VDWNVSFCESRDRHSVESVSADSTPSTASGPLSLLLLGPPAVSASRSLDWLLKDILTVADLHSRISTTAWLQPWLRESNTTGETGAIPFLS